VKRRGFTLIELMVVIGIIAILSTLLIIGVGKLQTNAKRQQTVQLLENCRAMWAEYDSVKRLHIDQFIQPAPGNVTAEAEMSAEQTQNTFGDRIGIEVIITRAVFSMLRTQPNIRAEMDKFPSGRMFLTYYMTKPSEFELFYGVVTYTASNSGYPAGSYVTYNDPSTPAGRNFGYLCIHSVPLDQNGKAVMPTPPPTDPGYWMFLQQEPQDPVLLDAWGNPIICVIGGELGTGGQLNANGTVPLGSGVLKAGGRSFTVSAPDKRTFWASAGPDGDFSKGDDNLYSFEKF
jgi:prepilin-type N-terminal cleavage/methylation domain-containing protein